MYGRGKNNKKNSNWNFHYLSVYVSSCSLLHFQRLASGDQQKTLSALQKDTPQKTKKGYTTNTNFKSVYEPQFNHNMWKYSRRYSQPSCSGEKYYFSRNIPHPRMVCHIPGKSCWGTTQIAWTTALASTKRNESVMRFCSKSTHCSFFLFLSKRSISSEKAVTFISIH